MKDFECKKCIHSKGYSYAKCYDEAFNEGCLSAYKEMISLIKGISFCKGFGASTFNRQNLIRLLNKKVGDIQHDA